MAFTIRREVSHSEEIRGAKGSFHSTMISCLHIGLTADRPRFLTRARTNPSRSILPPPKGPVQRVFANSNRPAIRVRAASLQPHHVLWLRIGTSGLRAHRIPVTKSSDLRLAKAGRSSVRTSKEPPLSGSEPGYWSIVASMPPNSWEPRRDVIVVGPPLYRYFCPARVTSLISASRTRRGGSCPPSSPSSAPAPPRPFPCQGCISPAG